MKWLVPYFDATDLAPEDVILDAVRERLIASEELAAIFGGGEWVQCVEFVDAADFERLPKILITAQALDETPSVGLLLDRVTVYVVVRFEVMGPAVREPGDPGLPTLLRVINRALGADRQLVTTINGSPTQLARRGNPGAVTFRPDRDPASGRLAWNAIMPWEYEVSVDVATQRIRNMVLAGG